MAKKIIHRTKKSSKNQNYLAILIIAIVLVVTGIITFTNTGKVGYRQTGTIAVVGNPAGFADLSFSPATLNLEPNVEQTIELRIDAGTHKVLTATIELAFDASKLGTPTVEQGSYFGGSIADPVYADGKIKFVFNALGVSGGGTGSTGSGVLATIKFKPTVVGNYTIAVTDSSIITSGEQNGNVLKSAINFDVVVANAVASAQASAAASAVASAVASAQASAVASAQASAIASADPSVAPSPTPNTLTSGIVVSSKTCDAIYLEWNKVSGASGYTIELADNKDINSSKSSGQIGSDQIKYHFANLVGSKDYYVRLTVAGSTKSTVMGPIQTSCAAAATPTPTATPKPGVKTTAKPTVKPTILPTATATPATKITTAPKASPLGYTPYPSFAPTVEVEQKDSFIVWMVNGIASFIGSLFGSK